MNAFLDKLEDDPSAIETIPKVLISGTDHDTDFMLKIPNYDETAGRYAVVGMMDAVMLAFSNTQRQRRFNYYGPCGNNNVIFPHGPNRILCGHIRGKEIVFNKDCGRSDILLILSVGESEDGTILYIDVPRIPIHLKDCLLRALQACVWYWVVEVGHFSESKFLDFGETPFLKLTEYIDKYQTYVQEGKTIPPKLLLQEYNSQTSTITFNTSNWNLIISPTSFPTMLLRFVINATTFNNNTSKLLDTLMVTRPDLINYFTTFYKYSRIIPSKALLRSSYGTDMAALSILYNRKSAPTDTEQYLVRKSFLSRGSCSSSAINYLTEEVLRRYNKINMIFVGHSEPQFPKFIDCKYLEEVSDLQDYLMKVSTKSNLVVDMIHFEDWNVRDVNRIKFSLRYITSQIWPLSLISFYGSDVSEFLDMSPVRIIRLDKSVSDNYVKSPDYIGNILDLTTALSTNLIIETELHQSISFPIILQNITHCPSI